MSTRIVCLDGFALNPGDIDWKPFEGLGAFSVLDRTPPDQIVQRSAGIPCLITNKVAFPSAILEQLPDLRYLGVLATGYNIIDVKAAKQHGIVVTNVPTYGTDSVAQHTIALILELARHIGKHDHAVHEGQWSAAPDFCFSLAPIVELNNRTLAVMGLGRIGQAVARIAAAMGMKILAFTRHQPPAQIPDGLDVEWESDIDRFFARADVLTLHCPLNEQTKHLVNARRLKLMKPSALVINTSRGPLVDSQALADALRAGRIAGAALDVLDAEPPPADNPLLTAPRCVITPHLAWYAREARLRLMEVAAANLSAFLSGRPVNVVS